MPARRRSRLASLVATVAGLALVGSAGSTRADLISLDPSTPTCMPADAPATTATVLNAQFTNFHPSTNCVHIAALGFDAPNPGASAADSSFRLVGNDLTPLYDSHPAQGTPFPIESMPGDLLAGQR